MLRRAVVLALAVTACGSSAPPPPAGEAKQAAQRYFAAFARADGRAMCRELTPGARKQAATMGRVSSCEEAGSRVAASIPEEVRRRLLFTTFREPRVDGRVARIEAISDDMFTERPRHATIRLEARDGAWAISGFPEAEGSNDDAVTGCALDGIETFDHGDVEPFWKRQGRAVYVLFLSKFCKRAVAEHLLTGSSPSGRLTAEQRRAIARIGDDVAMQMLRSGAISTK